MNGIKIAIAGVGNCASSLIQGLTYYKNAEGDVPGLMHSVLGGHKISDIQPVAAFDVDKRKVGIDLSKAIFARPNCTKTFCDNIENYDVPILRGPVLDGIAEHMVAYPDNRRFIVSDDREVDVVSELKNSKADVLINYMPVGSENAAKFYAQAALDAGCAYINCMPVFIASNSEWNQKFIEKKIPIIGDDIKSQVGATIVHRVLTKLFADRGMSVDRTYQLNTGGNTDFLNMLERKRLKTKKISKTESVQSQMANRLEDENIHVGPSDYVPWQNDNKICFIRMEGRHFGDVPIKLELRLSVEDSPNSAGVVIDAIRCAKIALDREIGGFLEGPSAYFMKHPPIQYADSVAKEKVEEFIQSKQIKLNQTQATSE